MWARDLIHLLNVLATNFPNVLIDHIDENGIVHCTSFHKISLRQFLDAPATGKVDYLRHVLASPI